MLGDIVRTVVESQPDMTLLRDSFRSADPASWRRPDPDVVVLSTEHIDTALNVSESLNRWPGARILVIEVSGEHTMLYELRPHATPLGALSPEQLVQTIRGENAV